QHVGDVDGPSLEDCAAADGLTGKGNRPGRPWQLSMTRGGNELVAPCEPDGDVRGPAETSGAARDRVENRLQIVWRQRDRVHDLALKRGAPNEAAAVGRSRLDREAPVLLRDVRAPHRRGAVEGPVLPIDRAAFRVTEPRGLFDERLENTLEVEGGIADGLEYLADSGLLVESRLRLVEEPYVLDCDGGLIRECLND